MERMEGGTGGNLEGEGLGGIGIISFGAQEFDFKLGYWKTLFEASGDM